MTTASSYQVDSVYAVTVDMPWPSCRPPYVLLYESQLYQMLLETADRKVASCTRSKRRGKNKSNRDIFRMPTCRGSYLSNPSPLLHPFLEFPLRPPLLFLIGETKSKPGKWM